MAYINDLDIQISLATLAITQQSFSLPLILGSRASSSPLCKKYGEYAELTEMVTAGFASTDPEYIMAGLLFGQSPRVPTVAVYVRDTADTIGEALDELLQTNNGWYVLMIAERDKTSVQAAGTWALANERIFIGCTADITALTGRNNLREAYLIHDGAAEFPEAAWVGEALPYSIGEITWKWRTPTGVVASSFTLTELNQIRSNKGQTFSKRSGVVYSDEGVTTGGEFIDTVMARDFVKARLGEALFSLYIKSNKVPFDGSGAAMQDSALREVFQLCGRQGIIGKVEDEADQEYSDEGEYMYTLSVPSRSEVPSADRAERKWSGIKFSFKIAGAVHKNAISGTITA